MPPTWGRLGDGVVDDGARGLHRDVEVGHPVLERLEAADRAAELDAVLGVFDGQVEAFRRGADLLGGHQDRRGVGQPGIGADGPVSCGSNRARGRVRSMVGTGVAVKVVQRVSVSPSAATTMSAIAPLTTKPGSKTTVPIAAPSASFSMRIGVGLVGGKQRELGQRRAQKRRRRQRLAQFLDDDSGVGELAPAPPSSSGTTSAAAPTCSQQQLPQRLVVAALRLDCLAHRRRRCVLVDQRRDGFAEQFAFFTHLKASNTRRRCHVGSPHADRNACTRRSRQ